LSLISYMGGVLGIDPGPALQQIGVIANKLCPSLLRLRRTLD